MKEIHLVLAEELERLAEGYRARAKSHVKTDEINIQDISNILSEKMSQGKISAIKELLKKYGAGKLVEVRPEDYPALFEKARKI